VSSVDPPGSKNAVHMYRAKGSAFPLHVHLERFLRTNSHAFRDEKRHTECHLCFSGTRRDRSPGSHTLVVFEVNQVSKRLLYTWPFKKTPQTSHCCNGRRHSSRSLPLLVHPPTTNGNASTVQACICKRTSTRCNVIRYTRVW